MKGAIIGAPPAVKYLRKDQLGVAGGVAPLDEEGKLLTENLPDALAALVEGDGSGTGTSGANAVFYGTIGTEWTEDAATGVKYQLVEIEGVTADQDGASLDAVMTHERTTEGYTLFVEEQNQFLTYITNGDAETVDGGVMFYIYGEANTVEIPFVMEVG